MTKLNWQKVNAQARYDRGQREEESGLVTPHGDNRPAPTKCFSYEEKKWIKQAQKLVADYVGNDGNMNGFKRTGIKTVKEALKVLRIHNGTEYATGRKKGIRPRRKPKSSKPNPVATS